MSPITKTLKRHVHGSWPGIPGANIHLPTKWTVGQLQRMLDEVRAAGFDDTTELKPAIGRDPIELSAFKLDITEHVANEQVAAP